MQLAYVILAHVQPEQLARLIRRLGQPGDRFYVHIDRKTPLAPFLDGMGDAAQRGDVSFVERAKVQWGAFGQLRATLNGLEAAVRDNEPFDHVILLTGRDYPVKPVDQIKAHLAGQAGSIFLEHHPLPREGWPEEGGLERLRYRHVRLFGPRWKFPRPIRDRYIRAGHVRIRVARGLPRGLRPFQGSSFWWLPHDAAEHVVDVLDSRPEILRFFRWGFAPEESFFQMVLLNSPLADRVVSDNLRYTEWRAEDWPHGSTLRVRDFPKLEATEALFASKFDTRRDAEILDLVDGMLARSPADGSAESGA